MLVLSRAKGERIFIGEGDQQITLTITDVRGSHVRVGVECDRSIPIRREEVKPKGVTDGPGVATVAG